MKKIYLLLIIVVFFSINGFSQFLGSTFSQNFSFTETGLQPQNWASVQDDRGIMYFANTGGVLEFDGTNWRQILLENNYGAKAICKDSKGRIYVGGPGFFGYLAPNSIGEMNYFSISSLLDTSIANLPHIISIVSLKNEIYFQTNNEVFKFAPYANSDSIFDASRENINKIISLTTNEHVNGIFVVNNILYFVANGIYQLKNNNLIELPFTKENLDKKYVFSILPYSQNKLLIVTRPNLYIYDIKAQNGNDAFSEFKTDADAFLNENQIYCAISLPNNKIAIGTKKNGTIVINKEGKIQDVFSANNVLNNNSVWGLYFKDNILWHSLNIGISKVEQQSPFRFWNDKNNIDGVVLRIIEFENSLYLSTFSGILHLKLDSSNSMTQDVQFKKLPNIEFSFWDFTIFNPSNNISDDILLASSYYGIFQIKNNISKRINTLPSFVTTVSDINPNVVFSGSQSSLCVLKYDDNDWNSQEINNINGTTVSIAEASNGDIWLGTYINGIYLIRKNERDNFDFSNVDNYEVFHYDTTQGVPTDIIYVYKINNEIVFATQTGFYRFNEAEQKFVSTNDFGTLFGDEKQPVSDLVFEDNGNIWVDGDIILKPKSDGTYLIDSTFAKRLPEMAISSTYQLNDSIMLLGSINGLFSYNKNTTINDSSIYNAFVRKVVINSDSIIFNGTNYLLQADSVRMVSTQQSKQLVPTLKYENNSIFFYYSAGFYEASDDLKFSYQLQGFDKKWSNWSLETKKEYTNLHEGKYIFEIRAKNVYGTISTIASYQFEILPPWYRAWWAYICYLIIAVFFMWIIVKLNTQRITQAKIRLEGIVKQRTAEIFQQKEEIQTQADNLEQINIELYQQKEEIQTQADELAKANLDISEKNEQITASIRYAKTIQKAVLPFDERIASQLDFFVLFRPKDIVSGDFYWYSYVDSISFIAVVDCTGHGVPGAFMSMIGTQLLNKIVNEDKVSSPAQILKELDEGVRWALKQETSNNHDGMDTCLCKIEKMNEIDTKITFSGAKRPLFYYQSNKKLLSRIVGNRKSIAGYRENDSLISFENSEIMLQKNDMIYLTTDGYVDQNNKNRKRLGTKKLKQIFSKIACNELFEQKQILETELDTWQENEYQRDDITIVGVRM